MLTQWSYVFLVLSHRYDKPQWVTDSCLVDENLFISTYLEISNLAQLVVSSVSLVPCSVSKLILTKIKEAINLESTNYILAMTSELQVFNTTPSEIFLLAYTQWLPNARRLQFLLTPSSPTYTLQAIHLCKTEGSSGSILKGYVPWTATFALGADLPDENLVSLCFEKCIPINLVVRVYLGNLRVFFQSNYASWITHSYNLIFIKKTTLDFGLFSMWQPVPILKTPLTGMVWYNNIMACQCGTMFINHRQHIETMAYRSRILPYAVRWS